MSSLLLGIDLPKQWGGFLVHVVLEHLKKKKQKHKTEGVNESPLRRKGKGLCGMFNTPDKIIVARVNS